MAMIVLPYGVARPPRVSSSVLSPGSRAKRRDGDGLSRRALGSASPVDYRLTVRTQMALAAVAGRPGLNNREVSEVIGLSDQSQISRMMKRLSEARAWSRTPRRTPSATCKGVAFDDRTAKR